MPPQAFDEISHGNKALYSWVNRHRTNLVVPTNKEIFGLAGEVTKKFPSLVDAAKIKPDADPYVISLARWFDKKPAPFRYPPIIVTEEANRPNKIPYVASYYKIPFTNFEGLLRKEGWWPI